MEKTPTNERFLDRIWSALPGAKVVHVLRHPEAVVASRKRLEQRVTGAFRNVRQVLKDLARSYRVAAQHSGDGDAGRHLILRYEDVVSAPSEATRRLAAFLEIEPLPILLRPTVAGLPSSANTSFVSSGAPGRILTDVEHAQPDILTSAERDRIAATVGDLAAVHGYVVARGESWQSGVLGIIRRRRFR